MGWATCNPTNGQLPWVIKRKTKTHWMQLRMSNQLEKSTVCTAPLQRLTIELTTSMRFKSKQIRAWRSSRSPICFAPRLRSNRSHRATNLRPTSLTGKCRLSQTYSSHLTGRNESKISCKGQTSLRLLAVRQTLTTIWINLQTATSKVKASCLRFLCSKTLRTKDSQSQWKQFQSSTMVTLLWKSTTTVPLNRLDRILCTTCRRLTRIISQGAHRMSHKSSNRRSQGSAKSKKARRLKTRI